MPLMGTTFTSAVITGTAAVEMDGLQRFNPCSVCVWIVYLLAIGYTAKRTFDATMPKVYVSRHVERLF